MSSDKFFGNLNVFSGFTFTLLIAQADRLCVEFLLSKWSVFLKRSAIENKTRTRLRPNENGENFELKQELWCNGLQRREHKGKKLVPP